MWPAIFEAVYLLAGRLAHQEFVWQVLDRGALRLLPMRQYAGQPMDLAGVVLTMQEFAIR